LSGAGGAFAFPVIVFAPLAIIRTGWNRWIRLLLAMLVLLDALFVATTLFSELTVWRATCGLSPSLSPHETIKGSSIRCQTNRRTTPHPNRSAHNRQYVRLTGSAYVPIWAARDRSRTGYGRSSLRVC
jgi:hypothetical protein